MNLDLNSIRDDIAAFADDDNDVVLEPNGQLLFVRHGRDISCSLSESSTGHLLVNIEGTSIPYRQFLSHQLARLDVLAQRLASKRPAVRPFINGPAKLDSNFNESGGGDALTLLDRECTNVSPFSSRIVFITADAGHGKTALLGEYQARRAEEFISGRSHFLFWHVNLQGRQLLRLSEALMGDLSELRMAGLYMPSVICLLRHRASILAIDGFDELAAEQGSTDALGTLALLVKQMQNSGTIVAASRRTFFDTDDYLRRAGMFRRALVSQCEFDQIHLRDWGQKEGIDYLSSLQVARRGFSSPETVYGEILSELGGETSHPMVARPFLLAHIAKGLLLYDLSPSDFIRGMRDPMKGVASVVEAFVNREVTDKWKARDTNEPYLTVAQHMRLLADVAEEMWIGQTDRLDLEVIEYITLLLLDAWGISAERKPQTLDMVKMHVLLTVPVDGSATQRGFDHPEFRDYFTAFALARKVQSALQDRSSERLARFLSQAQLPDAVARYAASVVDKPKFPVQDILKMLYEMIRDEWRPTFLHTNVGTFVPFLLNGYQPDGKQTFSAKVNYLSLVFEHTQLRNLEIIDGNFVRTSFVGADWENVHFVHCELNEVAFDKKAKYKGVRLEDCKINGVRLFQGSEEVRREFAPLRIAGLLAPLGIEIVEDSQVITQVPMVPDGMRRKLAYRFLEAFRRTTSLSSAVFEKKFGIDAPVIKRQIIPLMIHDGIIQNHPSAGQDIWVLRRSLEEIQKAAGGGGDEELARFWREIDRAPVRIPQ